MACKTPATLSWLVAGVVAMTAVDAFAQQTRMRGGTAVVAAPRQAMAQMPSDPLNGPVVTGAPYSGVAVTTTTQTLGDGTRIEQRTEAKFYRDGAGRARREQTIVGLPVSAAAQPQTVITIATDPANPFAYTLDPATRTARRGPLVGAFYSVSLNGTLNSLINDTRLYTTLNGASATLQAATTALSAARGPMPTGGERRIDEALGTKQMEGVTVTGRKTTTTIPAGQIGNDRAIEITDERWESTDLRMTIYSRFSDPRTGVVEFRLSNINRTEPPADLFAIPPDYTLVEPGIPGTRGRGDVPAMPRTAPTR